MDKIDLVERVNNSSLLETLIGLNPGDVDGCDTEDRYHLMMIRKHLIKAGNYWSEFVASADIERGEADCD